MGILHILEKVFSGDRIVFLSDQDAYWDFLRKRTPKNSLRFLDYVQPDFIVLSGCCLTTHFPAMWSETLAKMKRKGTRLVFLSAGLLTYTAQEIATCRSCLQQNPPFAFISRDEVTYKNFCDLAEFSYNGIDTAFWVSDSFTPIETGLPQYVIFNFDKMPEPRMRIWSEAKDSGNSGQKAQRSNTESRFDFWGQTWTVEFPWVMFKISRLLKKFYPYCEALLYRRGYPDTIGGFKIARPDHQINPTILGKSFRRPSSFSSDIPYTYLSLYANTTATFSDRVHACIVTLAYGKPAMLFSKTSRVSLLERVGTDGITNRPVSIPTERLRREKEQMIEFLARTLFP